MRPPPWKYQVTMTESFIFYVLFVLYFWCLYSSETVSLPRDTHATTDPVVPPIQPKFDWNRRTNRFRFKVDGSVVWEDDIPESCMFHKNRLVHKDPCFDIPDGQDIPAVGPVLYEYLKNKPPADQPYEFVHDAPRVFRDGNIFHFTCRNRHIDELKVCPSGKTFAKGRCEPIGKCTGKPDMTTFPNPDDFKKYSVCMDQVEEFFSCQGDTFFLFNSCTSMKNTIHYCQFYAESFSINATTRLHCDPNTKAPYFEKCPKGTQFFDPLDTCETSVCDGQADGTKLPLPERKEGPFKYVPGYVECHGNRTSKPRYCPLSWDSYLTEGPDTTQLPMVFDGEKCSLPSLCTNVALDDPEATVPVHEFSKHVSNWKMSQFYDTFAGYRCRGTKRERVSLDPGRRIKKFKVENACESDTDKVPLFGSPFEYYDCGTRAVVFCGQGEEFDGVECQSTDSSKYFKFYGMSLFRFDNLEFDDWIKPWSYSKEDKVDPCYAEESPIFIGSFNVCSHPECVEYAFLSQLPSLPSMLLPDKKSQCVFAKDTRHLKKESVHFEYDFWSQRRFAEKGLAAVSTAEERCRTGQRLQTGHFVWDSSLFATCDPSQPFVFCPSSLTQNIVQVAGKRYVCQVPDASWRSEFKNVGVWTAFPRNYIKNILPVPGVHRRYRFKINRTSTTLIFDTTGYHLPENTTPPNLNVEQPLVIEFRYRSTYPPDVVYKERTPQVSTFKGDDRGAYLVHVRDFTIKPAALPVHNVENFARDFV